MRPRDGWGFDLFIEKKCARCLRALGLACEACHGTGADPADRKQRCYVCIAESFNGGTLATGASAEERAREEGRRAAARRREAARWRAEREREEAEAPGEL